MNALLEISKEETVVIDEELGDELQRLFSALDIEKTGVIGIESATTLLKAAGLDIPYKDVIEFMTLYYSPEGHKARTKDGRICWIGHNNIINVTWWHMVETSRANALNNALQKMDVNDDGTVSTRDALVVLETASFKSEIDSELMKEVILQKSTLKIDDLNIRRLVRSYNDF